jgi:hypothetical protein
MASRMSGPWHLIEFGPLIPATVTEFDCDPSAVALVTDIVSVGNAEAWRRRNQ